MLAPEQGTTFGWRDASWVLIVMKFCLKALRSLLTIMHVYVVKFDIIFLRI